MTLLRAWACTGLLLLVGCGSSGEDGEAPPGAFRGPDDGLSVACHPFRAPESCSTPFPSSVYLEPDAATPTGWRVALLPEAMPKSASTGQLLDPTEWNRADGFSPATPIVVYFPDRLDPSSLPSQLDFTESLDPASATLLVDMDTFELVAHFSELDWSADIALEERQPLMLRPAQHLRPGHRYAVAITKSLKTLDGATPERPPGFQSGLGGATSQDPVPKKALDALPEVLAAVEAAGVRKDDLLLAWDFRTSSIEAMVGDVLHMRDEALAAIPSDGIGYAIDTVELNPRDNVFKRVRGTFTVPSFLEHDERGSGHAEVALVRGSDGRPQIRGNGEYPFDLMIPLSASTRTDVKLLIYGHGLLGSALDGFSGTLRGFCNDKGYVCIGTDFTGLSEMEAAGVGANAAALDAIKDVSALSWLSDRVQQAHINQIVLVRTAQKILADPQTFVDDGLGGSRPALADASDVVYYGISQGGIFGASFMAYTPDVQNGVLQVGGSGFSLFVQRSVNWNEFFPGIRNGYPDRVDQQVVLALWQPLLDRAEGSGTAWAQGNNPEFPGIQPKNLLFQIATGDSQVPNLGSNIQARTLQIPLLVPSAEPVWGLTTTEGGTSHAIVYYDLEREPPPTTNATPAEDNRVHGDIRKLPQNMEQTDTFLRTGKVVNTCGGPCSFPGFP
jgi:hypothetical protein